MSLYRPSIIAAADADVAAPPYFGGEFAAYVSHKPARLIGEISLPGSNSGTYTANAAQAIVAAGENLQIVARTYLKSSAACTVNLNVTNDLSAAVTAQAIFTPPSRAADRSYDFQRGVALDLILSAGSTIKAIGSIASIVGGFQNVKFGIYALPVWPDDYYLIGCTTTKNFNTKGRVAKGVDCGMETDAFVKRGKTKPANLTISQKFAGFHDGLARLDGGKVTCMLRGIKDGQITGDVLVFTEWTPTFANELPDGDGEAMQNSDEGKYSELLMFFADNS